LKKITLILCMLLMVNSAAAMELFEEKEGIALLDTLQQLYKPSVVLSYEQAKDATWTINRQDGQIFGVYSDISFEYDTNADPSSDADANFFNVEHAWCQSWGADDGPPRSDLHHLFTAQANVNTARSNYDFGTVDLDSVFVWAGYGQYKFTTPTTGNLGEYSKVHTERPIFEPRDSVKGDIARAIFYFYCMYKDSTEYAGSNAVPIWFETLIQWNYDDPVSDWENYLNWKKAAYQGGKPNPFIVDPTLGYRAYYPLLGIPAPPEMLPTAERAILDTLVNVLDDRLCFPDTVGFRTFGQSWLDWVVAFTDTGNVDTLYFQQEQSYDGEIYSTRQFTPRELIGSGNVAYDAQNVGNAYYHRVWIWKRGDGGILKLIGYSD
jgi:endonuclease I